MDAMKMRVNLKKGAQSSWHDCTTYLSRPLWALARNNASTVVSTTVLFSRLYVLVCEFPRQLM